MFFSRNGHCLSMVSMVMIINVTCTRKWSDDSYILWELHWLMWTSETRVYMNNLVLRHLDGEVSI